LIDGFKEGVQNKKGTPGRKKDKKAGQKVSPDRFHSWHEHALLPI
jgi:hypothetical protein